MKWFVAVWALLVLGVLDCGVVAVKDYLFRKCDQNPFCKRNRHYADSVRSVGSDAWKSPYALDAASVTVSKGQLFATVVKTVNDLTFELPLTVSFLVSGGVRVSLDEKQRLDGNIDLMGSSELLKTQRYNVSEWAFSGPAAVDTVSSIDVDESELTISVPFGDNLLTIERNPLKLTFSRNGQPAVIINGEQLLNYEHWRPIDQEEPKLVQQGDEEPQKPRSKHLSDLELDEGLWDDTFDGHKDVKVRGPESVAVDIAFAGFSHVYGIPEHADSLSLRETRVGKENGGHSDPYRLYNVDIFEYETASPMAMYGSIPFMQAHKVGTSAGVFWANAADTYVDVAKTPDSTNTHWMSETGLLDVFVFLGDSPAEISRAYGMLTGFVAMPQMFAIGYHQCRWNYNSQEDVLDVSSNFDAHDIPYDVIWLDIEYTDEKKYFTWNEATFPDHIGMLEELDESKRKLVAIIDPHIKAVSGYSVVDTIKQQSLAVKNVKGDAFHGHCWPGESVWIDTFAPAARDFWTTQFDVDKSFGGNAPNLHIWNDMNEPSVFSGPESTMPKDNVHFGGWEHRDVHNINGMTLHLATVEALRHRYGSSQRPFVLTRSYFAGSQRIGPMWTGDNMAKWEYLKEATPMLLTSGVSGMPFCGADVGGFFGNPSAELLARWYQAGAFYPFFRGHAHIDSKRREPYLFDPPYSTVINEAIRLRYRLLPTIYTAFHDSSKSGAPILKPLYYVVPDNAKTFAIDDEFFVGDSGLLVKPVTDEGATSVDLYLPDNEVYYDYDDYKVYQGEGEHKFEAPLEKTPVVVRGGHIHTRRDRPRRSSELMKNDPYTIVVAVNSEGSARGSIYIDDGVSYEYGRVSYVVNKFSYADRTLSASALGAKRKWFAKIPIERIIIIGAETVPQLATIHSAGKSWEADIIPLSNGAFTVRNPRMLIGEAWSVEFA